MSSFPTDELIFFKMLKTINGLVLLGKSTPGNHGFYHEIDRGFRFQFSHHPIPWNHLQADALRWIPGGRAPWRWIQVVAWNRFFFYWLWINTYENTIFRGLFTSINPSYFDVNYRGTIGFDTLPTQCHKPFPIGGECQPWIFSKPRS